ncbi:MAG: NADH:ubiquinone oxidoreductase [Coriobacteriales bacterium]|jgi:coenzyme F420-reducing hydrogenase gamma subunit|nr:NADH:ubiquinone oxidoreductase [Coriobacteriales bacterium]
MQEQKPRVLILGLASDFGCQLQITNAEPYLLDILSQFELVSWQLVSSMPLPEDYDVAVIEGAVVVGRDLELLHTIREKAAVVITIGACAHTGGVPGLALLKDDNSVAVYSTVPDDVRGAVEVRPVKEVIAVDYEVVGCPINTLEFVAVLQRALAEVPFARLKGGTLCGTCKLAETVCFYERGMLCLGLVTNDGCGAACTSRGRPCFGCRGLSPAANTRQARGVAAGAGIDPAAFDKALEVFNARSLVTAEAQAAIGVKGA